MVTLSVAGILKEVLTVIVASIIFDDRLTPVNITGLCIAIGGIAAYNYIKYRSLQRKERRAEARGGLDDSMDDETRSGGGGKDYRRVAAEDDEGDEESRVLFAAPTTPGTSATAAKAHPLAPEDDERRRREQRLRQEEADMDGWESSGEFALSPSCHSLLLIDVS